MQSTNENKRKKIAKRKSKPRKRILRQREHHHVNELNRNINRIVNQVRRIVETEMNMEAAHDVIEAGIEEELKSINETEVGIVKMIEEKGTEIEVWIEIDVAHHMTGTKQEMRIEVRIKIDMKIGEAVQLTNIIANRPAHDLIVRETTKIVDVMKKLIHLMKVHHRIVTAQMIHATINDLIIKSQRKSIRKSHPKSMIVPMMIDTSRRKRRKVNVKGPDQQVADKD